MRVLIFVLMLLNIATAQKIYFSKYKLDSQADVIFVSCACKANTLVHITNKEKAGRTSFRGYKNWYISSNKAEADLVYRVVCTKQPNRKTLFVYIN